MPHSRLCAGPGDAVVSKAITILAVVWLTPSQIGQWEWDQKHPVVFSTWDKECSPTIMSRFRTTSHTTDPTWEGGLFCPNDSLSSGNYRLRRIISYDPCSPVFSCFPHDPWPVSTCCTDHSPSFFWLISAGGPFLTGVSPQFLGFHNILISSALQCPWTLHLTSSWWNPQPHSWQSAAISSPNILDILLSSSPCLCAARGTG